MTYNEHGKRIRSENLAGRIATKVAQGEGGLGLKTDMAYTVKHIQKGQALLCNVTRERCFKVRLRTPHSARFAARPRGICKYGRRPLKSIVNWNIM